MDTNLDFSNGAALLANVKADTARILGGGDDQDYVTTPGTGSGGGAGGMEPMKDMLEDLMSLLQKMLDKMSGEGTDGGSGSGGGAGGGSDPISAEPGEVIAGTGKIWGDPHFIGQDGGKYDVQGEAGKTYNLLSDQNFQMNGRFDQYKNTDGLTVVGAVGISAGSDQVSVEKDGTVMVNGEELKAGESVDLADGGSVSYNANGRGVTIESGEWTTDISFQNKGNSSHAHLNIDVSTDNAVADGVKPHGLLGQTFDSDDDARNGDAGKGTQGGGAIEGLDGEITERGDRTTVENYEVGGLYDRNFDNFNNFFDEAESNMAEFDQELKDMMAQAFGMMAQTMMMMMSRTTA